MSKDLPKRMSVNLNEEGSAMLEELHKDFDISRSKVFRKALELLYEVNVKDIDADTIFDHLHLLNERKHLALNKEMVQAAGEELGSEKEEINDRFYEIGNFYWREYEEMGLKSIEDVLIHLENHNWFRAIKKNEGKFTLDLRVEESCNLLKCFLEGVFDQSPHEIELEKIRGKILVKKLE